MDTRWADEIERSFGDGPTPPAPATYVEEHEVKRDGAHVGRRTGGSSTSENPNILFTYAGEEGAVLDVTARDTSGRVFQGRSSGGGS